MRKIKLSILGIISLAAVTTAFMNRPCQACAMEPLYYYTGTGYSPAGIPGTNYLCESSSNTCTYILLGSYQECQTGTYTKLGVKEKKK